MRFKKREKLLNEAFDRIFENYLLEDIEAVRKRYTSIDDNTFYWLIKLDPTYTEGRDSVGNYGKWLLDRYKKDPYQFDNYRQNEIIEALKLFHDNKKAFTNKDINQFKTVDNLFQSIENIPEIELSKRQTQRTRKKSNLNDEAELVYEDENWEVWNPLTKNDSCKLGSGARWCTATTSDDNMFEKYAELGNLYILINKQNEDEKYQYFDPHKSGRRIEFRDKNNYNVNILKLPPTFPDVKEVPELHKIYQEIRKYDNIDFDNYIYDGEKIPDEIRDKITGIIIKDGVTTIGNNAFEECTSLTSINIPNSVTTIGDFAFYKCTSLESITIPNSVKEIGNYAFTECTSLESITIHNGVTTIKNFAFVRCTSLESITIPNSVEEIGHYAFYDCNSLTSITIPNGVTKIDTKAFDNCNNLTIYTNNPIAIEYAEKYKIPIKSLSEFINESYKNTLKFKIVKSIH